MGLFAAADERSGMEWTEGGLAFTVQDEDAEGVFFNPTMELNRDLTVAILTVARDDWFAPRRPTYLDAMTATGVRGIRAADGGYDVTLCDVDAEAVALARENVRRHELEADVCHDDARVHLYQHHYDVVDLDPFGSPMPFVDAAWTGTAHLLCVTATDTAPLCGAHLPAGIRRYSAIPANTAYHAEVGLRVLLSALARSAARHDIGVEPVLSHVTRHYVRTYLRLERGAGVADSAIERLGYLLHCDACLHREPVEGIAAALPSTCPACDGTARRIGPIWLGRYADDELVASVEAALDDSMGERTAAERLLARLREELDVVGHHDHHVVCDRLDVPAGPMAAVLDGLESRGFRASRTHFGGTTFKTDAPAAVVSEVVETTADSA